MAIYGENNAGGQALELTVTSEFDEEYFLSIAIEDAETLDDVLDIIITERDAAEELRRTVNTAVDEFLKALDNG